MIVRSIVVLVAMTVIVAMRDVHMLMRDFFLCRRTDFCDVEVETQRDACQRMISVHRDLIVSDIGNGENQRVLFVIFIVRCAFKLHADFQRRRQTVARLDLDQIRIGIVFAKGVVRLDLQLSLVTGFLPSRASSIFGSVFS